MKKITIPYYTDPSHGWLKVPMALVKSLRISGQISTCSYIRKDFAYLEEDRDATILIDALGEAKIAVKYKMCHANKYSKIRSYSQFSA